MFSLIIFSLLILSISCIDLRTYSFRFDQLSLLNESYIQGMYNFSVLRVTKFNRTTFCLNYEFETFREFDTNILIDYSISSRRLNSDQFTTWLDAPRRESISSAINRYERFFRNGLKKFLEHSNLPATLPMPYIRLKPVRFTQNVIFTNFTINNVSTMFFRVYTGFVTMQLI